MIGRRHILVVACAFLLDAGARAQAAPDLSTPASAAKSLWTAVAAADVHAITQALHAENDAQRKLAALTADLLVAGEHLKRAAHEAFGEAGAAMGRRMIDLGDLSALDEAIIKETGDVATLTIAGAPRPLEFRRSPAGWRLVIAGPEAGRLLATPSQAALLRAAARAIAEATGEIRGGEHATAEAASSAVERKLHAVMIDAHRGGATQPATQPAQSSRGPGPRTPE